jgi:hypothetical protein
MASQRVHAAEVLDVPELGLFCVVLRVVCDQMRRFCVVLRLRVACGWMRRISGCAGGILQHIHSNTANTRSRERQAQHAHPI